ncbi:MAG: serine/threonine protein kinase [Ktedonobacteraceae bacterium]|nr:serine/threonine protein kinase [Ktedonobacteraceae bacterium]
MNAEELIGTVLGTCTLQKLLGQGGMGAVFLAQQSRPKRQVAVKVLLPMTPLSRNQLAAFLERFRRETDAAASLEHPNITPVHEYGERDGLAYLVMPYISGGTLRDEMEREGALPLEKVVNYLDQMAAALDCAHDHGVIHRDIKPANILMTPEGRLLLTDFGLVKIVDEGRAPQIRLTGAGAPVGTPDYMAPEQVIGEEVDVRADLYSLGVVLYQMVTGTTPFQGETPMQIAAQHLQIPPPSPQMLRPDLPVAAEQVMLRALAKRPSDRYMRAQDLANAFRMALVGTGIQLSAGPSYSGSFRAITGPRIAMPGELFNSGRQTGKANTFPFLAKDDAHVGSDLYEDSGRIQAATNGSLSVPRAGSGLLSRTGKFPQIGTGLLSSVESPAIPSTGSLRTPGMTAPLASPTTTGRLPAPGQQGSSNTVKLTGPVKVVQVPVAGQPGRFVTGILPMVPQTPEGQPEQKKMKPWMKLVALAVAILLVGAGIGGVVLFARSHLGSNTTATQSKIGGAPDAQATAGALATATVQANIIMSDHLDRNINNWLTTPANVYAFKDGAYHITDRGNNGRATVLQSNSFTGQLAYSLTMQEVNGNDTSPNNSFGMIFRFSQQTKGNATVTTFYSFEVVNMKGGEYQFWKYDDSKGTNNAWTRIWHGNFGAEFHLGHGAQASNTFRVFMQGNSFTFTVNGKVVKTAQDKSFQSGMVGMIVNLNGTEVAFKDLLLTHN